MPSASMHLTHAELLTSEPSLAAPLREAMQRELVYARLGAVFPDLPFYTNIVTMMLGYWLEMPAEKCPFAQKMHRYHPDLFAWHFLTESRKDRVLTTDQRLALLAGFFSHLALDLDLHPLVNWIARRDTILHGGHESHHHRLAEKYQSLFLHRELEGDDCLGKRRFFVEKSRIVDDPPFFRLNVGLPIVRWATDMLSGFFHESAPSMRQFSSWVRSFRHFGFVVSLPPCAGNSQRLGNEANHERYFENSDFRFHDFFDCGYERSVQLLNLAYEVFETGDESVQARDAFLAAARIGDLAYPPDTCLPSLPSLPEYQEPAALGLAAGG
jgi:hypothetical protein